MRKAFAVAALCALLCLPALATVTVQAPLYDLNGLQSTYGFMRVELVNCGFNVPMVPNKQFALLHSRLDLQPGQQATIYGNDEITCGGVESSLYHVTMFTDSGTAEPGDYNYQIVSGPAVWSPTNANPWSGALPAPGWQEIYANPTANQSIVQPPGTTLFFQGQIDFTGATVTGLTNTNPYTLPPATGAALGGVKGSAGVLTCGTNAVQNGFNPDGSISCISVPQTGGNGLCAVSSTLIVNANRLNNIDTLTFNVSSPPLNTGCQFNITGNSDNSFNGGPFTATSVVQQGTQYVVSYAQAGANTNTPGSGGSLATTGVYNLYPLSPNTLGSVQGANGSTTCPSGQVSNGFDQNGVLQCVSMAQAANALSLSPSGSQAVAQPVVSGAVTRTNVNNLEGVVYADQFNFTPLTPSAPATLVAGLNTLTLATAPPGVSGTDTYANYTPHWLFITSAGGDSSPSEAVPIAGGSCVQGATNCTLQIYTGFSHNAGYTIASATFGIQEAERSFSGPNGVIIPPIHPSDSGTAPTHLQAPIFLSHNSLTFRADGASLEADHYATALNMGDTYTQWGNALQWDAQLVDHPRIQPGLPKFDLVQGTSIASPASINPGDGARVPIASITISAGTATVEFANNRAGGTHPFSTGNSIYIYSPSNWALTGTYTITVLNNHQFTFPTSATGSVTFDTSYAANPVTITVSGSCPTNLVAGSVLHSRLWLGGTYNGMLQPPYGLGEWAETVGGTCAPGVSNGTIQIVSGGPGMPNNAFSGHSAGYWLSGGVQTAIEDNANDSRIITPAWVTAVSTQTFGAGIQIDNDQNTTVDGWAAIATPWRCDQYFCSKGVYGPGPYSSNAGIVHIQNSDLSMNCKGNPVEWFDGNDIDITHSILQSWGETSLLLSRSRGGFGYANLDQLHEENGCTNPIDSGLVFGDQVWGFPVTRIGPLGWAGGWPSWTPSGTSGQNSTWYYLSLKSSATAVSVAIPIGSANVNDPSLSTCGAGGVSSCNVTLKFPAPWGDSLPPTQADILRVTASAPSAIPSAPVGTGAYLVGSITNFASACNSLGVCSFVDNVPNASLQSYTVRSFGGGNGKTYGPMLAYYPGQPVLTSGSNATEGSTGTYSGLAGCFNTSAPSGFGGITVTQGTPGNCPSPTATRNVQTNTGYALYSFNQPYAATTMQNAPNYLGSDGSLSLTGRLNFGGGLYEHSIDAITIYDSKQDQTDATSGVAPNSAAGRRQMQTNDIGIGTDMADPLASYMQQHAGSGINFYLGTVPANTTDNPKGWQFQLSPSTFSTYLPISLLNDGTQPAPTYQSQGPELTTPSALPPTGFQRGYFKAGTGWCSINSAGTEFCPGSGGTASPLTTKGDLYVFGSANARLPVGANGQTLVADSTQTLGVKWSAVSSLTSPLTTKGDIWVFDGVSNNRLPASATNGFCLVTDNTQTVGLKYQACTSGLATVATTGSYTDLINVPTFAAVATTGAYSSLTGTPSLATVATSGLFSDLSGKPNYTSGTDTLNIGTINVTTLNVQGAYQLQSAWPAGALAASPANKTNIGINNDGQLASSVSGDGPFDFARRSGSFTAGNQVTTNAGGQLVDSGIPVGGGGGGSSPIQAIQQNGSAVTPVSSSINFVQGGNIIITSPSAGQISIASTAGNVSGPGASTSGDVAAFSNASGTGLNDTGIVATNITQNSTAGTTNIFPRFNGAHSLINSALSDTGSLIQTTEHLDLKANALTTEVANAGTTGTTISHLAKLTGAPSTAVITATTDTKGVAGVVVSGAGTSGSAVIATQGQASCAFDAATTAGDYVQNSATTAGDCHDAGATFPTSGQVLGQVLTTNASSGTFAILIQGAGVAPPTNTVTDPAGTGILVESAPGSFINRAIGGTTNQINVANTQGASGNPTISISSTLDLSGNTSTAPVKTGTLAARPSTCTAGKDLYNASDQTSSFLFRCNSLGTGWDTVANSGGNTTSTGLTSGYLAQANGANSIINSTVDVNVSAPNTVTVASTSGVAAAKFASTGGNGGITGQEGTCGNLTPGAGADLLCPNSTTHGWQINNNNGGWTTLLTGANGASFVQGQSVIAATTTTLTSSPARGVKCDAFASAGDLSQALLACEAAFPNAGAYDATGFSNIAGTMTISRQPWTAGTTVGTVYLPCGTIQDTFGSIAQPSNVGVVGCAEDASPAGSEVAKNGTLIVAGTGFPVASTTPLWCQSGNGTNLDSNGCATNTTGGNFQSPLSNVTLSCAGKANCEPGVANNSQEGSDWYHVKTRNFQGSGMMVSNPDGSACTHCQNFKMSEVYSQEQGDYCTAGTHALYVNSNGGDITIEKGSFNLTSCVTTAPTGGVVRLSGQGIKLDTPHVEAASLAGTDGIIIGGDSNTSNVIVVNAYFANLSNTSTCNTISNANTTSFVTLLGNQGCVNSGALNLLKDQTTNTGTLTAAAYPNCGIYSTGKSGSNEVFSTCNETGPQLTEIANAGTTGTTVNKVAKLTGAPSTAVIAATTDTGGAVGIVQGQAGTTGTAMIAVDGQALCVFDGATTAGDYVQISGTAGGDCHDTGSTYPTSGQVLGRVLSTNVGAGTYSVLVFGPEVKASAGGGGGSVTSVGLSVNGASSSGIAAITGSPVTTSGTLNINFSGTSGGIPYFSSASVLSSSAALSANGVVIGGGAGAAPSTISTDTTTTHALFATAGAPGFRAIATSDLPGSGATTVNGQTCTLGSTCTITGGTSTKTTSYTLAASDSGTLIIMNCSAACTVTMYGTPTNGFYGAIESIGSTTATVSLNTKNLNGASTVPVLNKDAVFGFWSDGTNYFGDAPLVAGSGITLTPGTNGLTVGLTSTSTTANGQTCTLGSTCNVNSGATAHTVAVNEGNGSAIAGAGPGTAKQLLTSGGSSADPTYVDFPEALYVPAVNCNNATAGAGWSLPTASSATAACRTGTNIQDGVMQYTTTSSSAQFSVAIPADWDSATNPYIRLNVASTDVTSGHTIIMQAAVSCSGISGATDDNAFQTAQSLSTVTLGTTANQSWNTSVQFNSTSMTNCVAGGMMHVKVSGNTGTATNVNVYGATVTIPRLITVQAN